MSLYRVEFKNTDNNILVKIDADYSVNLEMLIPFGVQLQSDDLIVIELLNEDNVISSIYVSLENMYLAVKTIKAFYVKGKSEEFRNITLNNKTDDSEKSIKSISMKNDQALTFYFKTKLRKYTFYTVILIMLIGFTQKAIKDLTNGNLLSTISGCALIFLTIFIFFASIIIIKKLANKKY